MGLRVTTSPTQQHCLNLKQNGRMNVKKRFFGQLTVFFKRNGCGRGRMLVISLHK
jgi:hypothetical protein